VLDVNQAVDSLQNQMECYCYF